ncbi:MAG: GNAT superfamily N-acetyltransferase [Verrucomicrobiales bacterium]|jgi:GNAT superfamily N-acetyltransferase
MIQTKVLTREAAEPLQHMTFPSYKNLLNPEATFDFEIIPIVAIENNDIVGLALTAMPIAEGDTRDPSLLSVFVDPASRHRGIGTQLVAACGATVAERGGKTVATKYVDSKPGIRHFEKIMSKCGWDDPISRMLVIKCAQKVLEEKAPWLRRRKLSPKFEVLDWVNVSEEQREEIKRSHAEEKWIAEDLVPFDHEKNLDKRTSVALALHGKIVGWVINHMVNADTVRFTCSFVRKDLQRMGRVFILYQAASDRMEKHGILHCMWTVPTHHPGMYNFAQKSMVPFSISSHESRGAMWQLPLPKV